MSSIKHKLVTCSTVFLLMGAILIFQKEIVYAVSRNQLNAHWLKVILGSEHIDKAGQYHSSLNRFEESCIQDPQLCFYSAKGFYLLGSPEIAKEYLTNPNIQVGNNPLDMFWWGKILFEAGDFQVARDYWDNAGILRVIAEIPYNEGIRLSQKDNLEEAVQKYEQAVFIDPAFGLAHFRIGQIYWTFGRWREAQQAYANALDTLISSTFHWYIAKGKSCLIASDLDCEVAAFAEAVKLNPNDYAGLMHWARALIKQGKDDNAESALYQAQSVNPENKETYLLLGDLFLRQRKWELALEQFQKGLDRFSNLTDYWLGTAKAYAGMEQIDLALAALQNVLASDPDNPDALKLWNNLQPSP